MSRMNLMSMVGAPVPSDNIGLPRERAPSLLTWSPITYVGLLPAVRQERIAECKIRQMVAALDAPRLSRQGVTLVMNDAFLQLVGTLTVESARTRSESDAMATLAGTDLLGTVFPLTDAMVTMDQRERM